MMERGEEVGGKGRERRGEKIERRTRKRRKEKKMS